jgi:Putative Ig domain
MPFKPGHPLLGRALKFARHCSAGIFSAALLSGFAFAANVSINATNTLSTVAGTAFGIHTSVYDNQNGNAALPGLLIQSGVKALRYPGGGYADIFHWSVTRNSSGFANGSGSSTPWWGEAGNYGYIGSQTDFGNFVKLLTNANAQAVITVDYGSGLQWNTDHTQVVVPATNGQPQEAAAWVAYANANTNIFGTANDVTIGVDALGNDWKTAGFWAMLRASAPLGTDDGYNFLRIRRRDPVGIKYWEIGNETYGTGYYDTNLDYSINYAVPYEMDDSNRLGNVSLSPAFYGQQVSAFSQLMKAVDPTIKIGAVVSTPPGDYSWDSFGGQHWTPQVLAQCASNIDFVIAHWYPYAGNNANGSSLLSQVGSTIPAMINGTATHAGTDSGLRDWINDYRSDGTNVQIFITEFGYMGSLAVSNNNAPVLGPADALFAADCYATWFDYGVANVDYLEMNKTMFLGDSSPLVRGAVYYAIQAVSEMAGAGDVIVGTSSDSSSLHVHAAMRQDGKFGLLLINESHTVNQTVNVTVANATLATSGIQYQFGITNFPAPGNSGMPSSGVSTNSVSGLGNLFSISVPAYTMIVLTIPVLSNTPPVFTAIGNQTVNVGQTIAFTASATDTDQPPQTLTFNLLNAPANATLNSANGNFSWRPDVSQSDTTNLISLEVSDSGTPSLSATQSFTAIVNPLTLPTISSAGWNGGQFTLQVSGEVGPDYAVQVSTNLIDWSILFITNSPAMPFVWSDTNAASLPAQFYRIKAGPPLP